MKKALIFIIAILLVLAGCNGEKSENDNVKPDLSISPVPSAAISTNKPVDSEDSGVTPIITPSDNITNITKINISYLADTTHKYTNLSLWQEYIKDKFDIELVVNYIATTPEYLISGIHELDGVLYLNTVMGVPGLFNTHIYDYAISEIAVDLSPYYEKYGWNQFVETEYTEMLESDGAIYAVPAVNNKYIVPRYYNSEYLDILDMEVPNGINEFYDFLVETKKLNEDDPDFYPTMIWSHGLTQCTADIFRAYDVYVNSSWNDYFAYNPNSATFENAVFSDNFEKALTFIRTLQTEKLMGVNGISYWMDENVKSGNMFIENISGINKNFATEYNFIYDEVSHKLRPFSMAESSYEKENGYYLSYINSKNVCEVRNDISFYIFPKTLDNINGTIALFNDLFTDSRYYADLRYGIEDIDYQLYDDKIISQKPDSGKFMSLKQIKYIEDESASYWPLSTAVINGMTNELMFESNVFNQFRTYLSSKSESDIRVGGTFFDILFYESVAPYDAIEMYKSEFKKRGWSKIIDELNENMGSVSVYDYND